MGSMHHTQSPDTIHSDKVCSVRPREERSSVASVFDADSSLLDSFDCSTITSNSFGDPRFQSCDLTSYLLSNQQYSITAAITSAVAVAERYVYSVYGGPAVLDGNGSVLTGSEIKNRYSYPGLELELTVGRYHSRSSWMSQNMGQFLQRDPIAYEGSEWSSDEFCEGHALDGLDPLNLERVIRGYVCPFNLVFYEETVHLFCLGNSGPSLNDGKCVLEHLYDKPLLINWKRQYYDRWEIKTYDDVIVNFQATTVLARTVTSETAVEKSTQIDAEEMDMELCGSMDMELCGSCSNEYRPSKPLRRRRCNQVMRIPWKTRQRIKPPVDMNIA